MDQRLLEAVELGSVRRRKQLEVGRPRRAVVVHAPICTDGLAQQCALQVHELAVRQPVAGEFWRAVGTNADTVPGRYGAAWWL